MQITSSPRENHILAALPASELELLSKHLKQVFLPLGTMIYEPNHALEYAFFPTTAIASLNYITSSGASAEFTGVGNEGVLGYFLILGGNSTPSSAMIRTAGYAYRLEGSLFKEAFNRSEILRKLLLRYTQALMTEIMQTAACNRHHTIEQQLCRWLLLTIDRIPMGELVMTQELIAYMLGVRRVGIAESAGKLQALGFIRYRRGHITVLDRVGLQSMTCECYLVVKKELQRLTTIRNSL